MPFETYAGWACQRIPNTTASGLPLWEGELERRVEELYNEIMAGDWIRHRSQAKCSHCGTPTFKWCCVDPHDEHDIQPCCSRDCFGMLI